MITPTVTAANLDRCPFCRHLILTAFVYIQAVRKTNYVTPAHARCAELATADMPAAELEAAKAEHIAGLSRCRSSVPGCAGHHERPRPGARMTPSNRSTPTRRDGITLTMTLVTEPQYLAESLALALETPQTTRPSP